MTDAVAPTLQATLGQVQVVSLAGGRAVIEYEVGPHMCHSGGVALSIRRFPPNAQPFT